MLKRSLLRVLVAVLGLALPGSAQENHLSEPGSGTILSRSPFAHGYRHGYEEGYHQGNVDINLGRIPRTLQKAQFHGLKLKLDYSPSFGSKRSFEEGFETGLKAGYADGYAGRTFRVVDSLRLVAAAVAQSPPEEDPGSVYFDQGLAGGYRDGWRQQGSSPISAEPPDFHAIHCAPLHQERKQDLPAHDSYCEGYRRGFVLGQADALALRQDSVFLEASK